MKIAQMFGIIAGISLLLIEPALLLTCIVIVGKIGDSQLIAGKFLNKMISLGGENA